MRLVGFSDWSSDTITVYLPDTSHVSPMLLEAIADHICTLYDHVFMTAKPQKPTQSRWTGVAAVAQFCLGLALFHNLLAPLLGALAGAWHRCRFRRAVP